MGIAGSHGEHQDPRSNVTITLRTEQMPDGTWCAHMHVTSLANEQMADACMQHMQDLFCGREITPN